jgi:prepilin-type N-terminal cleavage/methylation domain-containing protein
MSDKNGFTLIEMIMVIFLITLVVGMSAAVFTRSLPSQRAEAVARELMATFRQARTTAVSGGKWQSVMINIDDRNFGIEGNSRTRNIPEGVSVKVIDPINGDIIQGGYRFVFSPAGVAEGGTVILWAGKRVISLEIDPIVGAVYSRVQR